MLSLALAWMDKRRGTILNIMGDSNDPEEVVKITDVKENSQSSYLIVIKLSMYGSNLIINK